MTDPTLWAIRATVASRWAADVGGGAEDGLGDPAGAPGLDLPGPDASPGLGQSVAQHEAVADEGLPGRGGAADRGRERGGGGPAHGRDERVVVRVVVGVGPVGRVAQVGVGVGPLHRQLEQLDLAAGRHRADLPHPRQHGGGGGEEVRVHASSVIEHTFEHKVGKDGVDEDPAATGRSGDDQQVHRAGDRLRRSAERLARFWCAVLGYEVRDEEDGVVTIGSPLVPDGKHQPGPVPPTLTFARVPEGKTVKNRLHLDVNPTDVEQDEEVRRLLDLGARRADVGQGDESWVVLADPEGNEFCVLAGRCP